MIARMPASAAARQRDDEWSFQAEVSRAAAVNQAGTNERETARNSGRTSLVRNLSFSLRSLLALALRLVRISQAMSKPRLTSLPTNICGFIALAAWLRMGTEGTRKQVWFAGSARWQLTGRVSRINACLFPSLNQLKIPPTHHSICGALRHPSTAEHVSGNFVPRGGVLTVGGPVVERPVELDQLWRPLAVSKREQSLVPDKLVGLRKTYGWRLSRRARNFLPFQYVRQPKYKSVLELFAVVGRNAWVGPCGEDQLATVASKVRLDRCSPQPQLDQRLVPQAVVDEAQQFCSKVFRSTCQPVSRSLPWSELVRLSSPTNPCQLMDVVQNAINL
ncbi:hypothetical protein ETAA8_19790 [Anatilimnocola aggregata]|uniref:Uncharacterized protein n=1 Tax=Anatilimnocola aggregata TaxID=2528021 RepID=A0A517Y9I0_9BACT|nr:hypothetical protein ETAA8_19790 [Anatilimnocola aggregata]